MTEQCFGAMARQLVDANRSVILGTVDDQGQPWVAPVYFAAADYRELFLISSPEAAHSRKIAKRPGIGAVGFNSQAPSTPVRRSPCRPLPRSWRVPAWSSGGSRSTPAAHKPAR
jgi:Pyridoxamine 5'-phosphate oxidase